MTQVLFLSSNGGSPGDDVDGSGREALGDAEDAPLRWLDVDEEYRQLQFALNFPGLREKHVLQMLPDVRWEDFNKALAGAKSHIVLHFSGHGDASGRLYMKDNECQRIPVEPAALVDLLGSFKDRIPLVVLNACYSEKLASELASHIEVVIGMTRSVRDSAAIVFSRVFYKNLIDDSSSVSTAFERARTVVDQEYKHPGSAPAIRLKSPESASRVLFSDSAPAGDPRLAADAANHMDELEQNLQSELDGVTGPIQFTPNPSVDRAQAVATQLITTIAKLNGVLSGVSVGHQATIKSARVQAFEAKVKELRDRATNDKKALESLLNAAWKARATSESGRW